MSLIRRLALVLTVIIASPAAATSVAAVYVPAQAVQSAIRVQSQDIPEVVLLLARRAARAERRGDIATANELYRAIRALGYVVRRSEVLRGGGSNSDDRPNRDQRSGGDRDDDNDDDDDDDGDDDDD